MIADERHDQAALYTLRMLPADEALRFAREMESDPELRETVAALEEGAAALARTAPLRLPPPELKTRLIEAFRRERRVVPLSFTTWIPWALAACAVGAACALWLENRNLQQKLALETSARLQRAELQAQMVNLRARDPLANARIARLAAKNPGFENAGGVVVFDSKEQRGVFAADALPPAAGKDYQLWVIEDGGEAPVSAGTIKPPKVGAMRIAFRPDHPVTSPDAFALSIEPAGGSRVPRGEIVLLGR